MIKTFSPALCLVALLSFSACSNFRSGEKSEVKTQAVEQAAAPVELAPAPAADATPAPAADAHAEQALAEQPK